MSGIENDTNQLENKVNHRRKHNLPHVAIVGGMILSLGTAIVTGLRKSSIPHVVSSFCFVGLALTHLFIHQRQLSCIIRKDEDI